MNENEEFKTFYEKDRLKKSDINVNTLKKISKKTNLSNRPKTMGNNFSLKKDYMSPETNFNFNPKRSTQELRSLLSPFKEKDQNE